MSLGRSWTGAQELEVIGAPDWQAKALAYPQLIGEVEVGSLVVLNTSALDRGLGTGGYAMVAAVLPDDSTGTSGAPASGPGHLVKARYTPTQAMVLGVDEQESQFHSVLEDADSIDGMPVITADLHSSLPAILIGLRVSAAVLGMGEPKVAYVMSDGGALPAWFSMSVAQMRDSGWLAATISVGQAYGGDYEAVNVYSGLLAARHVVRADIAVVIQGPGNLGTGTRWGFSGVAVGEAMNAASILGGRAIGSLRVSGSDHRERHQGVSHHSRTALGRVATSPGIVVAPQFDTAQGWFADLAVPEALESNEGLAALISSQIDDLRVSAPWHEYVSVPVSDHLHGALAASPVRLSTMGRGYDRDPLAFLTAAAAGAYAVSLLR
ncbi:DUF3866 family protein [Populibacterium corticicola]|uniref:DUF3866 family protein n=1 Tax=Populibacterium corticicola TaxID=1812826 RepID=A0ABW5XAU8_9MICO